MGLAAPAAFQGLGVGLAQGRRNDEEQLAAVGIAPAAASLLRRSARNAFISQTVLTAAITESMCFAAKLLALRRAACLDQNRAALRRSRRVERPARGEEASLEVDRADLGGIDEHAGLAVHDDGVGIPRFPELAHQVDELVGHLVAQVVLDMRIEAEILRRPLGRGGDEVAAHPALRHQVQGGDQAGQQVRRVEAGRDRRRDAEMARRLGDQGHQRQGIVLRRAQGTAQIEVHGAAVVVRDEQRILEQQVVEAGPLQRPRQLDMQVGLRPVFGVRAAPGLVPAMHAVAVAEKPAKMEWTCRQDRASPPLLACRDAICGPLVFEESLDQI